MSRQNIFHSGRHVAAARAMAGLKQTELAELAGLHVNSIKRLEAMKVVWGSEHACNKVGDALRARGIIAETWPVSSIRLEDK